MSLLHPKKQPTKVQEAVPADISRENASMERAAKAVLYFLVFALPLFFWPGFYNVIDFPKQFLLVSLVLVALFLWLLEVLSREKLEIRVHLIYIPVVLLLVIWGASAFFSFSRYGSFWGWPLRVNEAVLTLFAFAGFFFLVHQLVRERKETILFLILLVASGLLVSLFGFLQAWGKFILPFDFAKSMYFNTIGSSSALAVFVAALLPLAVGMISAIDSKMRWFFVLAVFLMSLIVITINAWFAWVVLLVGSSLYLALTAWWGKASRGLFSLKALLPAMLFVAVSLLFLLNRESLPGLPPAPIEVYPAHQATLKINLEALKERPILGTGPGTFVFNYSKFKNPTVNRTAFWNTRFIGGASKVTDTLGSEGILGTAALLLMLGAVFYLIWQKIRTVENLRPLDIALVSSLVGVVAGQIISPSGLILDFAFWALLGLFLATMAQPDRFQRIITSSITSANNTVSVFISFAIVALLAVGVGFFYVGTKNLAAERLYVQGLQALQRGDLQSSVQKIAKSVSLNPRQDAYLRDLAQVYLALARQESVRQDIPQEQIQQNLAGFVKAAVDTARRASELEPKNVANWSVLGFVYQNLIGTVSEAENFVLSLGYERALELEPANPYLVTETGRVYLQKAILARQKELTEDADNNLAEAEKLLNRAIELKPDYAPAHFQLALAADLKGDTAQLINKLQETRAYVDNVNDIAQLSFQLGVLRYQAREYNLAKAELETAVAYNENFSNARYFLGLIYDAEGRRADAIKQFERIEALNPDNELVKTILANLREGRPALATEERPPQPPPFLEGQPEEIK